MRRALLLVLVATLNVPAPAWAQSMADFSGAWALDASRSQGQPARGVVGPPPLVITQTANELTIQTRRGAQSQTVIYKLDGSVSANKTENGDMVLSKSYWDGATLVTESRGALGESVVTTRELRRLNAGGNEMTVDATSISNQGAGFPVTCPQSSTTCTTATQVFTKTPRLSPK